MNTIRRNLLALGALIALGRAPSHAVDVLTEPALVITTEQSLFDAAVSPDGRHVVGTGKTSGEFGEVSWVNLWDASTGEMIKTLAQAIDGEGVGGEMESAFSPAGNQVVIHGFLGTIQCGGGVWGGSATWTVTVPEGGVGNFFETLCPYEPGATVGWAWSPDGSRIATLVEGMSGEEGTPDGIRIWDAATGEMQLSFIVPKITDRYIRYNQSTWLLAGDRIATAHSDGRIRLWDTATGQISAAFEGPFGPHMVISPDGNRAVDLAPPDQPDADQPRIWDLREGTFRLVDYSFVEPEIAGMSFSRDGGLLLVSISPRPTPEGNIILFDASTGEPLAGLEGAGNLTSQNSFSDDARYVVTLSLYEAIRVWDLSEILAKPRVSMGETSLEIRWHLGTLQFAPDLDGPWTDIPAASPMPLSPIGERGFFRVKVVK